MFNGYEPAYMVTFSTLFPSYRKTACARVEIERGRRDRAWLMVDGLVKVAFQLHLLRPINPISLPHPRVL